MHKANGFTRQMILTTIKMHGSMTAEGLGKELTISPVAVRQHLSALEAEGLIATHVERRGLGRPLHRYSLTARGDETFPRTYDVLANSLLEEVRQTQGNAGVDALFAARWERLLQAHRGRMEGKSTAARIEELARIQTENGFMATVYTAEERTADALSGEPGVKEHSTHDWMLVQHNCAICGVAKNYAAACANELNAFRKMLGEEVTVERETNIARGDHTCTYRIRPKGEPFLAD